MSFITVENLNKTFKVSQKDPGVLNAFKALFQKNSSIFMLWKICHLILKREKLLLI